MITILDILLVIAVSIIGVTHIIAMVLILASGPNKRRMAC